MRNKKTLWFLILTLLLLLTAANRGYWATVSQWREDQATNLWIGYTRNLLAMPVGQVSSVGTPNPNGVPMLSILLSRLPNLWVISTVLGLVQGALILWVCWLITGPRPLFFLLCLPALSSVVLGATSVELWSQWLLTAVNLFFFGLWLAYLRRPSAWKIAWLTLPMLLAPSIYLAGLVNAVLYFLFTVVVIWTHPPRVDRKSWIGPALTSLVFIGLAIGLTWIPYARAMAGSSLPGTQLNLGIVKSRVFSSIQAGVNFPVWNLTLWTQSAGIAIKQNSKYILSASAYQTLFLSRVLLFGQAALFLLGLALALVNWNRERRPFASFYQEGEKLTGTLLLSGLAFVILAYMLSPLLGGPNWYDGTRLDQQVQFLPFLLFAWFLLPFVVQLPARIQTWLRGVTLAVAAGFTLISLIAGILVIRSHLDYRQDYLSEADVPLTQKMQAVDFIARDWKLISTEEQIPVSYDLGADWDWVTNYGKQMEKWYPAPMTIGRELDFELLRVYGLKNSQEGIQVRSMDQARYIVSYAFLDPPKLPGVTLKEYIFGRLRVSVVQP